MPTPIVLIHDDLEFTELAVAAIQNAGFEVTAFTDPMAALDALEVAQRVDLLITRVLFPLGKPHGISLARMTRTKRPGVKVLFVGLPEFEEHVKGLGEFIASPVPMPDFMDVVGRMLAPGRAECSEAAAGPQRPAWPGSLKTSATA